MKDKPEIIATLIEKWQKRLELRDWEIVASIVDLKAMKKLIDAEVDGCIVYEVYRLQAHIYVLNKVEDVELESVILHEMLHIVLSAHCLFYKRIIGFVGDDNVIELLTTLRTDILERLLHQITSALLREHC